MKKKVSPGEITEYVRHFQKSRILLTALEFGIFTILDKKPLTSKIVAKKIKANARATDRLMNALTALGFLEKKGILFSNAEHSEKYFVFGKRDFMSGLLHSINVWDTWTNLTESIKKGRSVIVRPKLINNRNKEWLKVFINAMHYRALRQAPDIVKLIDMKNINRVLDIGGGSGAHAMAFTDAGKQITATVFDLPNIIPITKKFIKENGYLKKVDTFAGDYNKCELPKGYDLIFISAVVHINSYSENIRLMKKCVKALNPKGVVVIQDHVMKDNRTEPVQGAMFALNMLVGTEKGDTYTESEIKEWFQKSGLHYVKRIPVAMGNSLIIGKK